MPKTNVDEKVIDTVEKTEKEENTNDNLNLIKELKNVNVDLNNKLNKITLLIDNVINLQLNANTKKIKHQITASSSEEEIIDYLNEVNANLENQIKNSFALYQLLLDKFLA